MTVIAGQRMTVIENVPETRDQIMAVDGSAGEPEAA